MNHKRRPAAGEFADYYNTYVSKVPGDDFFQTLKDLQVSTGNLLNQLTAEQWDHRYQVDKWSIKEVLIHLLDAERVFAYRALRISRNDSTPLPGFEQNAYVPFYNAANRSAESIIKEYQAVRNATLTFFETLSNEDLNRIGTASGFPVSVLGLGYIIAGHELHHMQIIKERYLSE